MNIVHMYILTKAVLNVIVAGAIYGDSRRLESQGGATILLSPPLWAIVTLFGGILGLLIYWLIHHSLLGSRQTS